MNKFLLGVVVGTLLGFLFASQIYYKNADDTHSTAALRATDATTQSVPAATIAQPGNSPAPSAAREPNRAGAAPENFAPGNPLPPAASTPSASTANVGSTEGSSASRDGRSPATAASTQRTAIPVPDGIKPFLEKSDTHDGLTLGQMHAKLEDESDDYAWAYQMEMYLQQSFARPTKSGQPLDIRIIECRTTMCEIAGFSQLPNPTDDINGLMQYMSQQPWWDFDNINSTASGDDSSGKFLLFLRRKH